jgi:hypothetical protein
MPLTYSKVMSRVPYLQALKLMPYTGYSAILYKRWLPFAILIPIFAAIGIVLSLFLPWFSISNTAITNAPIRTYTGFQIASSSAKLGNDTFSFPLWLLILLGITLIVFSLFLLRSKVLTPSLKLSIHLTFGFALLVEIIYLFTSLFGSFLHARGTLHNGISYAPAINVENGLWVCMLLTVIAGGACLILFSELSWYWTLAQVAVEEVEKRTKFRTLWPEREL